MFGSNKDELATSLAALLLHDIGVEVTSENLQQILTSSNNIVASYWPALFAGLMRNVQVDTVIDNAAVICAPTVAPVEVVTPAGPLYPEPIADCVDGLDENLPGIFGGVIGDY